MADDDVRDVLTTLDEISAGGQRMVALAHDRLRAAQAALAGGRFDAAEDRLAEATSYVSPLAHAERGLAQVGRHTRLVDACDLEVGMRVPGQGEVEGVSQRPGSFGRVLVEVRFEGCPHLHTIPADAAMPVEMNSDSDSAPA